MKLTKETLREIIKEVIAENDGHPQIVKKIKKLHITERLIWSGSLPQIKKSMVI